MPDSSEQAEREQALREVLTDGPAATQQALVDALLARGLPATQSSVSRDLKRMGVVKTAAGYDLPSETGTDTLAGLNPLLRGARPAGPHLLVVQTAIGAAQRVALELDRSGWPEIVGNIGGDDTVFVATASGGDQRRLLARLDQALNGTV